MSDMDDWNAPIIAEFRANRGVVGGEFEGAALLILHTTGAKSGKPRVQPLMYQAVGDDFAIFASYAGGPKNPGWYHNLQAEPAAEIQVGQERKNVVARTAVGEERERLWSEMAKEDKDYSAYQQRTEREFPVVILDPVKKPAR